MALDAVVERVAMWGNLLGVLGQIDGNTWQTSQEAFADWKGIEYVNGVSTANMGIYRLVDGEAVFDLLGREGNPLVDERFQKEAYRGMIAHKFFFPQGEMKQHVLAAIHDGRTVTVPYSGLRVKTRNFEKISGYVEYRGRNTDEEKKLFVAVYGTDDPGWEKKVHLLTEGCVGNLLAGRKIADDFIVLACQLSHQRDFFADAELIDGDNYAVRGVRRGNVQKSTT